MSACDWLILGHWSVSSLKSIIFATLLLYVDQVTSLYIFEVKSVTKHFQVFVARWDCVFFCALLSIFLWINYFTLWSWINSVWNYILTLRIILWCETVLFLKWWIWSNQLYFSVRLISCFAKGKVVYQIEWIIWCKIIFFST